MPDWLTHVVIGLVIIEIFSIKKKSLILLGTILPDILPKIALLKMFIHLPVKLTFFKSFHTPFIMFLGILIIAPIFRYNYKKVVLLLSTGALTHFITDAMLKSFIGGMNLFYPFSLGQFRINLIWPEKSYLILLPTLLFYFLIIIYKNHCKYKRFIIKKEKRFF